MGVRTHTTWPEGLANFFLSIRFNFLESLVNQITTLLELMLGKQSMLWGR